MMGDVTLSAGNLAQRMQLLNVVKSATVVLIRRLTVVILNNEL